MEIAGVHMVWALGGHRLIMVRGITIHFLAGALSEDSRGAGCLITMADGCSVREWAGCGARPGRLGREEWGVGGP